MTATFYPLVSRPFVTINADLTDPATLEIGLDETDMIVARCATRLPLIDAVVRLRYRATEAQHRRVDVVSVKKFILDYSGAAKLYQVAPEIVREDRARVARVDENLSPQEALRAWVEANGLSDDQAARLRELMEG